MAASNSTDTAKPKRDRYYTPNPIDAAAPGVTCQPINHWQDEYRGTAEALAAAGLLPLDRFPGMPGQNKVSAAFKPARGPRQEGERARDVPGHLEVFRRMDGLYRAVLVVDREERARRQAERAAELAARDAAEEAVLSELPRSLRTYLNDSIRACGGAYFVHHWFNDPMWLSQQDVTPKARVQVLSGLEMMRLAKIEREMVVSSLGLAKAVLARFGDRVL